MALLRLVYDDLVNLKFREFIQWWNAHPIRKQYAVHDSPSGVPDNLFYNPSSVQYDDGTCAQAFGQPVLDAELDACDSFIDDYESKRPAQAQASEGLTRITRGDLSLPCVSEMTRILSELAKPTMENAKSIYRVALFMLAQKP